MKDTCVRPCGASPNTIYQSTEMTEWMLLFHRFAYNAYRTPTKLHGSRKAVFQGNVRTHSRSYCCSKSNETENNVREGRFIQLYYFVKRALAAHHHLFYFIIKGPAGGSSLEQASDPCIGGPDRKGEG